MSGEKDVDTGLIIYHVNPNLRIKNSTQVLVYTAKYMIYHVKPKSLRYKGTYLGRGWLRSSSQLLMLLARAANLLRRPAATGAGATFSLSTIAS